MQNQLFLYRFNKNPVVIPHRYKILIDEINFSSENIFNLTYKLCHTFLAKFVFVALAKGEKFDYKKGN